ncbi:MAG: Beta-glucuronidase [Chloroflexi bacterium ADurb.Bin344]|nr:MAG: Beta-glucuronidase [Chloroflexi bacterium ADurb.Bin344]
MKTRWGNNLNPDAILSEYPRPQMVRDHYLILNGFWNYAITESSEQPAQFDGDILVPFSPESELSGVNRILTKDQYLWYRREIVLPDDFLLDHLLLHFGAVDQKATVYLNGIEVGSHLGGFTPFSLDITMAWQKNDRNILTVKV